jgi:hypothetical protein
MTPQDSSYVRFAYMDGNPNDLQDLLLQWLMTWIKQLCEHLAKFHNSGRHFLLQNLRKKESKALKAT